MKKLLIFSIIIGFAFSCQDQNSELSLEQILEGEGFSAITASDIRIINTESNEFVVSIPSSNQEDRRYFVLQMENNYSDNYDKFNGTMYFNRLSLIISNNQDSRKILFLSVDDDQFSKIGNKLSDFNVSKISGYGLSEHKSLEIESSVLETSFYKAIAVKNVNSRSLDEELGDGGSTTCTSGGVGSTGCSVDGCSVTCRDGYYACCKENNLLTDTCKCIKE